MKPKSFVTSPVVTSFAFSITSTVSVRQGTLHMNQIKSKKAWHYCFAKLLPLSEVSYDRNNRLDTVLWLVPNYYNHIKSRFDIGGNMITEMKDNIEENNNICKVNYHFIFPWEIVYRCGNCYHFLGYNLDYSTINSYKCPKCGYINTDNNDSNINIEEYPKIIRTIENEIQEIKEKVKKE